MSQLTIQLLVGLCMIGMTTALQAICIGLGMAVQPHIARHFGRLAYIWMTLLLSAAALWVLAGITAGVFLWAGALNLLGAFDHFETSLYYALAAYTTLGFGDVLTPPEWRIFGAMIGANGMLGFGLATAAMVEFMRGIRRFPHD